MDLFCLSSPRRPSAFQHKSPPYYLDSTEWKPPSKHGTRTGALAKSHLFHTLTHLSRLRPEAASHPHPLGPTSITLVPVIISHRSKSQGQVYQTPRVAAIHSRSIVHFQEQIFTYSLPYYKVNAHLPSARPCVQQFGTQTRPTRKQTWISRRALRRRCRAV